jgi:hypothetical protein
MVKGDPAKDELPDFSGPYVQGKRLERFSLAALWAVVPTGPMV